MSDFSFGGLQLPASVTLGALAAVGYLLVTFRQRAAFTLMHAMILVCIMAITTGAAIPFFDQVDEQTRETALKQTLHSLRSQIELYKLEHRGQMPLLFKGTFPQLTHATNADGVPGESGKDFPYGPYFRHGLPANPYTGVSTVTATERFPPASPSEVGGWLYHQETGQIAADLKEALTQ